MKSSLTLVNVGASENKTSGVFYNPRGSRGKDASRKSLRDKHPQQDSNLRPLAPEASALFN